jgi:phage terminase large subunit-like protein
MNLFKELAEIAESKDKIKVMQDDVLDLFYTDKKRATKLLKELNELEHELENIDQEINKLYNQ